MKKPLVSVLLSGVLLLTAGAARSWADTISFNNSSTHPDGSISIGGSVALTNGVIDSVTKAFPLIPFNITGPCGPSGNTNFGCMQLSTGAFIGPDLSSAANDYNYMGFGSAITITGGISSLGLGNNTVLWSGAFDPNANVILQFDDDCLAVTVPSQCTGSLTGTLGAGTFNPVLATALGINPNSTGGNDQSLFFQFVGTSSGVPLGSGNGNTNQMQVVTPGLQINPTAPVPESGSLILVGMGLVAGAKCLRRRKLA